MTAHQDHDDHKPRLAPCNQCRRITAVAEFLDISISTVRRLIRNGELKAIRIGASVRITEASLDRLLNAGRRRSTPRRKKLAAPGA